MSKSKNDKFGHRILGARPQVLCGRPRNLNGIVHEKATIRRNERLTQEWERSIDGTTRVRGYAITRWLAGNRLYRSDRTLLCSRVGDPDADIEVSMYQLFMYMQQTRHDKPDRQFFFGLLFSARKLSIWLSDRSGMLGTSTPFDIDQHPEAFIRVISAFCLLPPTRLGWYPKMKLCKNPLTRHALCYHSFDPLLEFDDNLDSRSGAHWVIEVPSKDNPLKMERFITLRALNLPDSMHTSIPASVVWAAVKASEFKHAKPSKIYVIKQTWRPVTMTPEAHFYLLAKARGVDVLNLFSYGTSTTTKGDIRRDVPCYLPKEVAKGFGRLVARGKGQEQRLTTLTSDPCGPYFIHPATRLLTRTYGWPVTFFKDLTELVEVLQDSIACHQQLYLQGILHRNIDSWNILICPTDLQDLDAPVKGRLVDFGNATATDTFVPSWLLQYEPLVTDQTTTQTMDILEFFDVQVSPALVPLLNACSRDFITFFKDLYAVFPELEGKGKLTDEDLGLGTGGMPNFREHDAGNMLRSATPFASAEVLVGEPMFGCPPAYNIPEGSKEHPISMSMARSQNDPATEHCHPDLPGDEEQPPLNRSVVNAAEPALITESTEAPQQRLSMTGNPTVAHRVIHDMEGFLWVTTRIALERSGPGGERRDFVKDEPKQDSVARFEIFSQLFLETDIVRLALIKTSLFKNNTYEKVVLRHIHPYFQPLKPILLRWWQVLRFAYRFPAFEDTHKHFLLAIAEEISSIKVHVAQHPHQSSSSLQERRAKDLASLQDIGGEPAGTPVSSHNHEDVDMAGLSAGFENGPGDTRSSLSDIPLVDEPKPKRPRHTR